MVAQHQMGIWLAVETQRRAGLVEHVRLALRATLRNKGVDVGIGALILHEFDPRGAHDLQHVALPQRLERNLRGTVKVTYGVQLKFVARTYETYVREERKRMKAREEVVLV